MPRIQRLSPNLINKIAAGEVIERPGSVVKELMENEVDAGATYIKVVVTDAGRTLIQVIDNGCGMSPDDAVLCFERHATSKLASPEDLHHILTFGFRGEALASIAAVAEVSLRTRIESEEAGVYLMCSIDGRQVYVTGHCEYDRDTLLHEYTRDIGKGITDAFPVNYFPDDDPSKTPRMLWRGHAGLLWANWLNYMVYQNTPYDLGELR